MEKSAYIFCSKCGAPMKIDARYCMKCGTLNYDHPDNQSMRKYADKSVNRNDNKFFQTDFTPGEMHKSETDVVVGGKVIKEDSLIQTVDIKSHNYGARIIYTLLFSIFCFCLLKMFYNTSSVVALSYSIYLFIYIFSFVTIANLYQKANYSFFTPFIPFYGQYVLCEMVFDKGILFLLLLIPFVNIVFSIILLYKLGEKFGIHGIISVLFFPIVILLISYSNKYKYKGAIKENHNTVISMIGFFFALLYLIGAIYLLIMIPILL